MIPERLLDPAFALKSVNRAFSDFCEQQTEKDNFDHRIMPINSDKLARNENKKNQFKRI